MGLGKLKNTYNLTAKFDPYKNFGNTAVINEYENGKTLTCYKVLMLYVDNNGNFKRFIKDESEVINNKIYEECKEFMLQYSDFYNLIEGVHTKDKIMNLELYNEDEETEETITLEKLLARKFTVDDFRTCKVSSYNGEFTYQFDLKEVENGDDQITFKGTLLQGDNINTLIRIDDNDPISIGLAKCFNNSVLYCSFDVSIVIHKSLYINQLLENMMEENGDWINFEKLDFDNIVITQQINNGSYYIDSADKNPEAFIRSRIKRLNLTEEQIQGVLNTFNIFYEADKEYIDNYRLCDCPNLLKNCCYGAEALIIPSKKLEDELIIIKNS